MFARDLMTTDVITVNAGDTVGEAVHLLAENRIRQIPILEDDGTILGLITARLLMRGILPKYITKGYLSDVKFATELDQFTENIETIKDRVVRDFIKEDENLTAMGFECVGPDTSIMELCALFINKEKRIHRIIVLADDKTILGIISPVDVFRRAPK